ncbi:MAG: hypothetical protein NTZ83_03830 [Candidatus Pacearchaeota archaeon]|nr:hypothetical protein [Candidatus Pacearchaeota archaeon]
MENEQKSKYRTIKDYVNFLASSNKVDIATANDPNYIGIGKIPQSMDEARNYSNFWNPVIDEFKEDIEKIDFFYQEKDKQLPLSYGKKLLKSIGFKIKPKTEEGEVKYSEVNPCVINHVNTSKSLVNMITDEAEWKRLNAILKKTDNFSAPLALLPKNLCYQVNIPLEFINGIGFKSTDFLMNNIRSQN